MRRTHRALAVLALSAAAGAARAEETWDGLTRVPSKRLEYVYLLEGADFRRYAKVLLDPPQVSFRKDWLEDVNRGERSPSRRITQADAQRIQKALSEGFDALLSRSFAHAGWQAVKAPGPDVLRLTPMLVNVDASAPQKPSDVASRTYAVRAGSATVGLEVRDSETGMLLGRVADRRSTTDYAGQLVVADHVTNRADFEALLNAWSQVFVEGLARLKELSPLGPTPRP